MFLVYNKPENPTLLDSELTDTFDHISETGTKVSTVGVKNEYLVITLLKNYDNVIPEDIRSLDRTISNTISDISPIKEELERISNLSIEPRVSNAEMSNCYICLYNSVCFVVKETKFIPTRDFNYYNIDLVQRISDYEYLKYKEEFDMEIFKNKESLHEKLVQFKTTLDYRQKIIRYITENYVLSDNIQFKIQANDLQKEIQKDLNEIVSTKLMSSILTELGLEKKRRPEGIFYFGIRKKRKINGYEKISEYASVNEVTTILGEIVSGPNPDESVTQKDIDNFMNSRLTEIQELDSRILEGQIEHKAPVDKISNLYVLNSPGNMEIEGTIRIPVNSSVIPRQECLLPQRPLSSEEATKIYFSEILSEIPEKTRFEIFDSEIKKLKELRSDMDRNCLPSNPYYQDIIDLDR